MKVSMDEASRVFEAASEARISRTAVEDSDVESFAQGVSTLIRTLRDDVADPYWEPVIRALKRVRWDLATTPLPISHDALAIGKTSGELREHLQYCDQVAPSYEPLAASLMATLDTLATVGRNPLGDAVETHVTKALDGLDPAEDIAVILPRPRKVPAVSEYFRERDFIFEVITPARLSEARVFRQAVLIGALAWYPSFAISAPRTFDLCGIQFGWVRDDIPETELFLGPSTSHARPAIDRIVRDPTRDRQAEFDPGEIMPAADWEAIAAVARDEPLNGQPAEQEVEAHLLLLASDQAVYVEASHGTRAQVVVLGAISELQKIETAEVLPGIYLVLREEGDGDYIPPIADSILGKRARELRDVQRQWKEGLAREISAHGYATVVRKLKEYGSQLASEDNVRRWFSSDGIRTRDYKDFQAIMKVMGDGRSGKEVWEKMGRLDSAHREAGA